MQAANFKLEDYLQRIGFVGEPRADIETITALMRCQLFSVPFENLDVQAGKIVSLVPEEIVEKIVYQPRGGYCYEVNGLFAMMLQSLNIPYQFIAARPMFYPVKRPKTHMAIIAYVQGEQWLCDLGFGSYGIRAPINLKNIDAEIKQDHDTFMLCYQKSEQQYQQEKNYILKAKVAGEWVNQYGFDLSPQEWIDFAPANYMNSTHPDAIFVQKLLIVLHNASGRHILVGDILKIIKDGKVTQLMRDDTQRQSDLSEYFGLIL